MKNRDKNKLAKWLDHLQQESWQLELIVSGFAIFLLLGAVNKLDEWDFIAEINAANLGQQGSFLQIGYMILAAAMLFLLINLLLHVLLRGVWISAIGLRYVSGDINYFALRLAPRFEKFLRRRIGSFDDYILRLENICSVVFAFTFLIVFMLVGLALFFALFLTLNLYLKTKLTEWLGEGLAQAIIAPVILLFVFSSLLYFIDFVTLGWLKRVRWFSVLYYPIYRLFSFITLAPLYRPLYYNLVDNKFGRRVGFLLVPYVITIVFLFSFNIESHVWFPDEPGKAGFPKDSYDDLREDNIRIDKGSIPSKFVKNGFLEIFIQYRPLFDDAVLTLVCPNFKPLKETGFGSSLVFDVNGSYEAPRLDAPDTALICMSKLYEIRVDDSVFQQPAFRFYEHPNNGERGLLTILDLAGMERGPHHLQVKKLRINEVDDRDTLLMQDHFSIPFWKE